MEFTFHGRSRLELATAARRRLSFRVSSSGCSILCGSSEEDAALIYSGTGTARVSVPVFGGVLFCLPFGKDGLVSLDVPELRHLEAGWTHEPSLADLSPRPYGTISPEIQAVMDRMNRNAIIREQALIRAVRQGAI